MGFIFIFLFSFLYFYNFLSIPFGIYQIAKDQDDDVFAIIFQSLLGFIGFFQFRIKTKLLDPFNPFWDLSCENLESRRQEQSIFQSLLGFIFFYSMWHWTKVEFSFNPFWDLSWTHSTPIPPMLFLSSFNPFWDLSKEHVVSIWVWYIHYFQSLLGFIITRYNTIPKTIHTLSIPFGIYLANARILHNVWCANFQSLLGFIALCRPYLNPGVISLSIPFGIYQGVWNSS